MSKDVCMKQRQSQCGHCDFKTSHRTTDRAVLRLLARSPNEENKYHLVKCLHDCNRLVIGPSTINNVRIVKFRAVLAERAANS